MRKIALCILAVMLSVSFVSCGSLEMLNDPAVITAFVGSR